MNGRVKMEKGNPRPVFPDFPDFTRLVRLISVVVLTFHISLSFPNLLRYSPPKISSPKITPLPQLKIPAINNPDHEYKSMGLF